MATQAQVAAHLFLDPAAVSRMIGKGILPSAARGELDLEACRQAYIEHIRSVAAGRDSSQPGSLEAERARLASAQAEAIERKNQIARGEVYVRAEIDGWIFAAFDLARARMERLPREIAPTDHALRRKAEQIVDDALRDMAAPTDAQLRAHLPQTEDTDDDE